MSFKKSPNNESINLWKAYVFAFLFFLINTTAQAVVCKYLHFQIQALSYSSKYQPEYIASKI